MHAGEIIYIGVLTLLASCFNGLFHATLGKTASACDPENNWYCKHSLNKSNNKITQLPRQYSPSKEVPRIFAGVRFPALWLLPAKSVALALGTAAARKLLVC